MLKMLRKFNTRIAKRGLLMVFLIVLANATFFLLNMLSSSQYGAWKLLIINTVYAFLVWIISEIFLDKIGKLYPNIEDTGKRIVLKLLTFFMTNAMLVTASTVVCYLVGIWTEKSAWLSYYAWTYGMVCFFGGIILAIYESLYLFRKWKLATVESEQLKREHLQTQLDSLKNQVNPHFLFNSLNSLSSLIEDDEPKAQIFVNELARVYRYLLQSNDRTLTDLKSELAFIEAYFFLLKTRFGEGISIEVQVNEESKSQMIPPLTLQILVENAVKHNVISITKPLKINIYTEGVDKLVVTNNLQSKTATMVSSHLGLANIASKYRLLSRKEPIIKQTEANFSITLPLLAI
jgi:two-component system, LytTR family, sensor kinase